MKLLKEYISFNDLEMITESVEGETKKNYYLKGPFLEANVKNRNGRTYMRDTLMREVDEFYNNKIKTSRSMGELDHPECILTDRFDVLTINGWIPFTSLSVGDNILTINTAGIVEEQPIKEIVSQHSDVGYGYQVTSLDMDASFTPNHRFILEDNDGNQVYETIENIFNNIYKYLSYKVVKCGIWYNENIPSELVSISNIVESANSMFNKHRTIQDSDMQVQKIDYVGNVFCLKVENSNFCMRLNDKSFWTGNSVGLNLDRVSHIITDLTMKDDVGYGVAKLIDTPMGTIAQTLIAAGVQLGMSTRGVGTLDGMNVKDDYKLITVDIVADPSAPTAFVEGVLESKEYIIDSVGEVIEANIKRLEENVNKAVKRHKYNRQDFSKECLEYLNAFINTI